MSPYIFKARGRTVAVESWPEMLRQCDAERVAAADFEQLPWSDLMAAAGLDEGDGNVSKQDVIDAYNARQEKS